MIHKKNANANNHSAGAETDMLKFCNFDTWIFIK